MSSTAEDELQQQPTDLTSLLQNNNNGLQNDLQVNNNSTLDGKMGGNNGMPLMGNNYNSIHYQGYMNQSTAATPHHHNPEMIPNMGPPSQMPPPPPSMIQPSHQQQAEAQRVYLDNQPHHTINMYNQPQFANVSVPLSEQHLQTTYQTPTFNDNMAVDQEYNDPKWDEQPEEFYSSPTDDGTPKCTLLKCFSDVNLFNLQRSFCFGAIDGLLTGSSITFAASGLGLFSPASPLTQRLLLIALTFSACAADGFCMAIGHVWSTFVVNENMARDRAMEVDNFKNHRGEAKARLVDLLLMRGMLKIDAMSIADTLEGYPDIFLGALTGDMMTPLRNFQDNNHGQGANFGRDDLHRPHRNQYDEYEDDDPNYYHDHKADAESRVEAVFMMFAFAVFSIIPPAVFSFVPNWVSPPAEMHHTSTYFDPYANKYGNNGQSNTDDYSEGISPTSVTVSILSVLMLFLGMWKR